MTDIDQWVRRVTRGDSGRKIAKAAGVHPATLNRQLADSALTPEMIVKIARGYGESAVPGLVAYGLLVDSDIAEVSIEDALERAEDEQLMDEVLRRMKGGSRAYDAPIGGGGTEPLAGMEDVNVFRLTPADQASDIDDEADDLDLPYVAHEPGQDIGDDDDESKYDI